jgi:hypothetical protein
MAITKGINTFATLEEAFEYFKYRLDTDIWDTTIDLNRESALVTATTLLDNYPWTGQALSESQALSFPRTGYYFDPKLGLNITFTEEIPKRVSSATFELAYHLLANGGIVTDEGSVSSLQIGPIQLNDIKVAPVIPASVRQLIAPLLINGGSNSWWRAN